MTDSVSRFSDRVQNYLNYRPRYPRVMIDFLQRTIGLSPQWTVADIGAGTGFLTERFLENGNAVFAVEPNAEMRKASEVYLSRYPYFTSIDGTAEATTLPPASVDLVTAGQAFHWFDAAKARQEFLRILRLSGWVVLVWNSRRADSSPFLREYESLLRSLATDYTQTNEKNIGDDAIVDFYGVHGYGDARFDTMQPLDWEGLRGRAASSSYVPLPGHPDHAAFFQQLRNLFEQHQQEGQVAFEYDTRLYYGQLRG